MIVDNAKLVRGFGETNWVTGESYTTPTDYVSLPSGSSSAGETSGNNWWNTQVDNSPLQSTVDAAAQQSYYPGDTVPYSPSTAVAQGGSYTPPAQSGGGGGGGGGGFDVMGLIGGLFSRANQPGPRYNTAMAPQSDMLPWVLGGVGVLGVGLLLAINSAGPSKSMAGYRRRRRRG